MTSRFTAIPVGSGEAFLLQTTHHGSERVILVDSGNLKNGSPHPLVTKIEKAAPKLTRIDIAVCTHQDRDHSHGFPGFCEDWCASGREIGEFWLPGRWAAAVPEILFDPVGGAERLWRGAVEVAKRLYNPEAKLEPSHQMTHEARMRELANELGINRQFAAALLEGSQEDNPIHGQMYADQLTQAEKTAHSLGVTTSQLDALAISIEESDRSPSAELQYILQNRFWWFQHEHLGKLYRDAIETAKTVSEIVEAAVRWHIPIRWFDFGQFEKDGHAAGGDPGFLEPLSAVEITKPPRGLSDTVFFFCLSLSRQNVESLVFHRPETPAEPSAVFLGDSRLSFGIDAPGAWFPMPKSVPSHAVLVTAPHHGSRVNDVAYQIVRSWLSPSGRDALYVRNGGHHKQKLDAFLKERHRCCAQCRQCSSGRRLSRTIKLSSRGPKWTWPAPRMPKCK
ncbi:MAG: hypothetical protein RLO08_13925 [Parvibaculaceae bacterium]